MAKCRSRELVFLHCYTMINALVLGEDSIALIINNVHMHVFFKQSDNSTDAIWCPPGRSTFHSYLSNCLRYHKSLIYLRLDTPCSHKIVNNLYAGIRVCPRDCVIFFSNITHSPGIAGCSVQGKSMGLNPDHTWLRLWTRASHFKPRFYWNILGLNSSDPKLPLWG